MDNHFTINYLQAIKNHLHIDFNTDNRAVFYPDKVCNSDFINLKKALDQIWKEAESAISIVRTREDAFVQMGLFGLVDDLDLAVKVGFSLGDRIVLVDYLYERILSKFSPERINITHIGSIASSLVNLLPLAEKGRIHMGFPLNLCNSSLNRTVTFFIIGRGNEKATVLSSVFCV